MNNLEITKKNGNIAFNEEHHKYFDLSDPSRKFISVTTMIEKFTQEFDKEFWSSYRALEKLLTPDQWLIEKPFLLGKKKFNKKILELYEISENDFNKAQQDVLDSWFKENLKSQQRGTEIHANLENSFYKKKKNIDISKYQVGGLFECRKDYTDLDLENAVYPEYLIHRITPDGKLCIAGQIDLLVKKGNHISIVDWKTNKEIKMKSYFNKVTKSSIKMKFPLNNLDDCNYSHYNLQLSTYAWMIQKLNPDFVIDDLVLVHFDHNDKMTIYHMPYLKDEVEKMLSYYKKISTIENNKAKRKRIEY